MDANRPRENAHGVAAEPDRVETPVVLGLFGVLAGLSIFGAAVVAVVFFVMEKKAVGVDRAAVAEAGLERPAPDRVPPAPRLEIHTEGHWRVFRDAEKARLSSYGWMDRNTGAVHIPIDRAMDLIAERGVGALPQAPVVMPRPGGGTAPPPSVSREGKKP